MIETYRFFVDAGADVIINHHQHCYCGYEVYKGKPIFYGLGNFCFDGKPDDYRWTSGYMVEIECHEEDIKFTIIPYRQCADEPKVRVIKGQEKEVFFGKLNENNHIIESDELRESEYLKWCKKTEGMFKNVLNPVNNKFTSWLFKGKIGNRIISKRKLLQTLDYLVNESHIERMRLLVEDEIKKR
jgi:poly-gamma-glutamate synthesis protein (capsule biosynthesis protein)